MNKNRKYKLNSSIVTLGVVAIVVLVNLFVSVLVKKFPIKLDLTTEKIYEITDQTKEMLSGYDVPVEIFYVAGNKAETESIHLGNLAEVLQQYAQYCPSIKYTSVDAERNPTFGTKYVKDGKTINVGSVILDAGNKFKVYSYSDFYNNKGTVMKVEQVMNSGLKMLNSKDIYTACFVKGHGEEKEEGLRQKLIDENYMVSDINLLTDEIPSEAKFLIITNPRKDYTSAEISKLDRFFENSGKAIITFDVMSSGLTNLYEYLKGWGILVNDDLAVETSTKHMYDPYRQIVYSEYTDNEITENLKKIDMPIANRGFSKSLEILFESNNGITTTPLLTTSDKAYSTTDFDNIENIGGNTGKLTISAIAVKAGDNPSENAAIFVSGNDVLWDFQEEAVNSSGFANFEYAMNMFSYLQGSYEDYSITPKYLYSYSERLSLDRSQAIVIGWVFILILPLIVLIYGIVVWVRRRHL